MVKSHVVKISNKKNIKEMFKWCSINCCTDYSYSENLSAWGSSWWTEKSNTEFHFLNEEDAIMFKLNFY